MKAKRTEPEPPPELVALVMALATALRRRGMYPPDHPSQGPAIEQLRESVETALASRSRLTISVGHKQLVLDGMRVEARQPLFEAMLRSMSDHHLALLAFKRGTTVDELGELLDVLSVPVEKDGDAIGLGPKESLPRWKHVELLPTGYDKLALDDEERLDWDKARTMWLTLVKALLVSKDPIPMAKVPGARVLARAISKIKGDKGYRSVARYLGQIVDELARGEVSPDRMKIRESVSELVRELDDDSLERLMEMGGDSVWRGLFVLNASDALAADAAVSLLKATATTSGLSISTSMTRLLTKMASHADGAGSDESRTEASEDLKQTMEELLEDWQLADPNPDRYNLLLDAMARSAPGSRRRFARRANMLPATGRVVQMSLELDEFGPAVSASVEDLVGRGMAEELLRWIEAVADDSAAAEEIQAMLGNPDLLASLLDDEDVDETTLRILADRAGDAAIDPLLDALRDSNSRAVRRKVHDTLVELGPDVTHHVGARLDDDRWWVIRNLLSLLNKIGVVPEGVDLEPFVEHEDERVVRDVFPLAAQKPELRLRTLERALAGSDDRLLRMALLEAEKELPDSLAPVVIDQVLEHDVDADLKGLAARALAGTSLPAAKEALLDLAVAKRRLMGGVKLGEPTPEVLGALRALSSTWGHDPDVIPVLEAAQRARDPDIRAAVTAEESPA
jgi:hypothetical protein